MSSVQRADVDAVDAAIGAMSHAPRHSKARTLTSGSPRRRAQGRVQLVCARAASRRCWCTRTRCGAAPAAVRTCRRRWPPMPGRRASPASRRRPARWPRASTSRGARWAAAQRGQRRRMAVGVVAHPRLDLLAQRRRARPPLAGSGISAGSFSRSAARSQPGTREPCSIARAGRRRPSAALARSPVDAPEDRVEHRERGDHVGDVASP